MKQSKPSISVVVPAHNEEKFIKNCLTSLKNQDFKKPFEVIVVDNNSNDETAKIAQTFGVKVIKETALGAAKARQAGFEKALADIVATTDADSVVPKNWLSTIYSEFAKNEKIVAVSGMYSFYNGSPFLNLLTYLFNYPQFVIFNWYSGANLAIKKTAFQRVGGFNTEIPISEDSDLCRRLKKTGIVKRMANFKVQTSARRFSKYGVFGGLFDYVSFHLTNRLKKHKKTFQSCSYR